MASVYALTGSRKITFRQLNAIRSIWNRLLAGWPTAIGRPRSLLTSYAQWQCRGAQGPKTVKGAQSDPNYVSRLLARTPGGPKIIVRLRTYATAYHLCHREGPAKFQEQTRLLNSFLRPLLKITIKENDVLEITLCSLFSLIHRRLGETAVFTLTVTY